MSDQNENATNDTAPAWMTTQTPKEKPLLPSTSQDVTPLPKARKPRRTKAQMLADAAARPDAEVSVVLPGKVVPFETSIGIDMAAEDHRDAVVRDVARIVPTARDEHAAYLASRLPIIAIIVALLSLATSLLAIVK